MRQMDRQAKTECRQKDTDKKRPDVETTEKRPMQHQQIGWPHNFGHHTKVTEQNLT